MRNLQIDIKIFQLLRVVMALEIFQYRQEIWKKKSWFFKVSTDNLISHKLDNIIEIPLKRRKMYV